jgi:hypothetical protein
VIVSYYTPAPNKDQVKHITWNGPKDIFSKPLERWSDARVFAGALILLMVILYYLLG